MEFQPTHLREVRLRSYITLLRIFQFQPTHLREVRRFPPYNNSTICLFQPTHLREVRRIIFPVCRALTSFNPRTCGRCDTKFL